MSRATARRSGATATPSSTRSTRSSSTRPARRSSSRAASPTPRSSTTSSPPSSGASAATTTTTSTSRSAPSSPTEAGIEKVEQALGIDNLYDGVAQNLVHQLQAALRAKELFKRDKDYIISNGEVKIVDEFTGRILEGRRWSEGLHQAVEAKEGVKIKEENQTLATITLQNYFRMYDKLAGMTGTASTEAAEFANTYDLQVVPVPTNQPTARARRGRPHLQDRGRQVRCRRRRHRRALRGRPARARRHDLGGEVREALADAREAGHRPRGAERQAAHPGGRDRRPGRAGSRRVTVATNMAGRGVDILLGGNPEILAKRDLRAEEVDLEQRRGSRAAAGPGGQVRGGDQGRGRQGPRARRPLRARHRAPRVAPHRQPAPGPRRSPGRSRARAASTCPSRTT